MSQLREYQTWLQQCDTEHTGVIVKDGIPVCRWCRRPYEEGGNIFYKDEHFQEEKTKRDWEVLKLRIGNTDHIVDADKSDGSAREYHIHSVKRLSDGEVFSIGDEVEWNGGYNGGILRFYVKPDEGLYFDTNNWSNVFFGDSARKIIKVVKPKPLFVTEDGVEIFEDDYYYSVGKEYNRTGTSRGLTWYNPISGDKYFSTAEAAVEFIIINKPVLSVKDVMGVFRNFFENDKISNPTHGMIRKALKQLAKEKLSK